jgi:hypothetical protein
MSTNNNRKLTNRVYVKTESMFYVVNVTTNDGQLVQGFYPNRAGVGRDFNGVVPNWFIKGIRDMRDTTKFPHLNRAIDDLAVLVKNTAISASRTGQRAPWGDTEMELFRISRLARYGVSEDTSTTLTYKPAEPSMPESATVSRVGGGLTKDDLAFYEGKPTCQECFIVVTESGCGC